MPSYGSLDSKTFTFKTMIILGFQLTQLYCNQQSSIALHLKAQIHS